MVTRLEKATRLEKRASLDRVLEAAKEEHKKHGTSIYECAAWIMYALARTDAKEFAKDTSDQDDIADIEETRKHTVREELQDELDLLHDDTDNAQGWIEDKMALGKALDPGYEQPILEQDAWID